MGVKVGRIVDEGVGSGISVGGKVVGGMEVEGAETTVGPALSVFEGVDGSGVNVAPTLSCCRACEGRVKKSNKRNINSRIIATINLKRSYIGARGDLFRKFLGLREDRVLFGEEAFVERSQDLFHIWWCELG